MIVRATGLALLVGLSSLAMHAAAQARSVGVEVRGCEVRQPELDARIAAPLARALGLELGGDFRVEASATPDHEVLVNVVLDGCEDRRWTLRIRRSDGLVLFGPEEATMVEFDEAARIRIAALWAAERLADRTAEIGPIPDGTIAPARATERGPDEAPDPIAGEVSAQPDDDGHATPSDAGSDGDDASSDGDDASSDASDAPSDSDAIEDADVAASDLPQPPPGYVEVPDTEAPTPIWWMASLGGMGFVDPASIERGAFVARIGLGARLHDLFFLSGALEGGVLVEPFDHLQPLVRLCGEPQLYLMLVDRVSLTGGPRFCASTSRHVRNSLDAWAVGLAIGGLVRLAFDLGGGLGLGVRVDADAWERDAIVQTSPSTPSGPSADLPWAGTFTGALELTLY